MENTLQFQEKAKVLTAQDQEIGQISRVVMNTDTKAVTHIVVRKKGLFDNEEKLVPIEQIAEAGPDQIRLSEAVDGVESLDPFEEKRKIPDVSPRETGSTTQMSTAAGMSMVTPAVSDPGEGRFITVIDQNIPEGTVAVKEGAQVITSEGKKVGKMGGVVADLPDDQATHLLVSKGRSADEQKLVPINWVDWLEEKEVHLNVEKTAVEELA